MPADSHDPDDGPKYPRRKREGEPPYPVTGEVIGTSKLKLLGVTALGLVLVPVCGFLLFDGLFIGGQNTVLPFRLSWWGYVLAVGGLLVGLLCGVGGPLGFLWPTQLVFGQEVFQEQRKAGGGWEVILQIPYANLRKVQYEKKDDNDYIGIRFHDVDDDEMYMEGTTARHQTAQNKGWDYILDGLYTKSLKEIAAELDDRAREAADDD